MAMVKAIFYVPLWDNDGSSLRDKQAQKRIRDVKYEMADRLRREMKKRPVRLERSKQE